MKRRDGAVSSDHKVENVDILKSARRGFVGLSVVLLQVLNHVLIPATPGLMPCRRTRGTQPNECGGAVGKCGDVGYGRDLQTGHAHPFTNYARRGRGMHAERERSG